MFASLKRLTKHSVVYGLSLILARSISFLLLPLHTNVFPKEAYGVISLAFVYLAVVAIFYNYGVDSAFLRYYLLTDVRVERRKIFSTALFAIASVSAFLSIMGWLAARPIADWLLGSVNHAYVMRLCAGILFFDALATLPFLILRAEEKSSAFAALKVANVVLNFALNYFFIINLKHGIAGAFEANLIASAFSFATLGGLTLKHLEWRFNRSIFKELLAFGLPFVPSTISVAIIDNISRVILEKKTDIGTVGLFSAGYKLGMIMSLIVAAFRFAWQPFFLSTSKQPDAKAIFSRVLTYFCLICSVIFLAMSFFVDDLVRIHLGGISIFGADYWRSTAIVPIVLLAYFFWGADMVFVVGVQLEKKTIYMPLVTGLGAVVNVVANYALIPSFGMIGAAWSTVMAYLAMSTTLYFISQKLYPIPYEWSRLAKLMIVGAILFVISRLVPVGLWGRVGLLLVFPAMLYALRFFHGSEIVRLKKIFGLVK